MNILTLGGATQDIFINHENVPIMSATTQCEERSFLLLQEGAKIEIEDIFYSLGGGATNAAVSFKRLGFCVCPFFKIGKDVPGSFILETLKEEGVNTGCCIVDPHHPTGISYIFPWPEGDRTILAFRGANAYLRQDEIESISFSLYSHLYITSLSGDSSALLAPLVHEAKKANVTVIHNPGGSQLAGGAVTIRKALPFIDILMLNKEEAQQLMSSFDHGTFTIDRFFQEMIAQGPQTIVVTNGTDGVYVYHESHRYFHPSMNVKVVNTLGAGDAFGSAFVAALSLFGDVRQAIRAGIVNSASVITHYGAQEGLLDREQLEEKVKELDPALLQIL